MNLLERLDQEVLSASRPEICSSTFSPPPGVFEVEEDDIDLAVGSLLALCGRHGSDDLSHRLGR